MSDEPTRDLDAGQLARLLAMGRAVHGRSPDSEAEATEELLAGPIPLDPAEPDSLPALVGDPPEPVLDAFGRRVRDLLLDPEADLAVLQTLKQYAKRLARTAAAQPRRTAAHVLYHATIAAALARPRPIWITSRDHADALALMARIGEAPWLPADVRDLLARARAACAQPENSL